MPGQIGAMSIPTYLTPNQRTTALGKHFHWELHQCPKIITEAHGIITRRFTQIRSMRIVYDDEGEEEEQQREQRGLETPSEENSDKIVANK